VASSAAGQPDQSPSSIQTASATTNAITANVHRRQKIYGNPYLVISFIDSIQYLKLLF